MSQLTIALERGPVEISTAVHVPSTPSAVVVIAHGAGAPMDHPFLTGLAGALAGESLATVRFNFPYIEAGRKLPGPAAHAIATWEAVISAVGEMVPGVPVVAAGKSYGGRMASMAASEGKIRPAALVYLGYPLHPPGRPDRPRDEHLPQILAPQLFLTGSKDPFVQPREQFDAVIQRCADAEVIWIEGGGHSFELAGARRSPDEIGAALSAPIADWIRRRVLAETR